MKAAVTCLTIPLGLASVAALAQDTGDAMEKLRACSLLAHAQRLQCLEKLSRDIGPTALPVSPAASAPAMPPADDWVVSETTSPLDYSPVVVATATYGGPGDSAVRLSIQCRGERSELVIGGPGLTRRAENYAVSYRVNDDQPVAIAAATPAAGTGVALRGDVVRLLTSLPDQGEITFRVANQGAAPLEGRYGLASLKNVLKRLAAPCRWPVMRPSRD
jgi:hypothetical protein